MFPSPPSFHDDTYLESATLAPDFSAQDEGELAASSTMPPEPEISPQQVRRSTRGHKTPSYLHDYVCTTRTDSHCMITLTNLDFQPLSSTAQSLHEDSQHLL